MAARHALLLGATLGLAILAKKSAFLLLPLAIVVLAARTSSWPPRVGAPGLFVATVGALAAPALVRNRAL